MRKRVFAALVGSMALLLSTAAGAVTILNFGGASDPSMKGTTGTLTVADLGGGNFDVTWAMNFVGYTGTTLDHPNLTQVDFKVFKTIGTVSPALAPVCEEDRPCTGAARPSSASEPTRASAAIDVERSVMREPPWVRGPGNERGECEVDNGSDQGRCTPLLTVC